jgi:hypothetical protein
VFVHDGVADHDVRALAEREAVEVAARVELDLVVDHRCAALARGAEAEVIVSTAPLSTSVSLASASIRNVSFSPVVARRDWR